MRARLRLILDVDYLSHGVRVAELKQMIADLATHGLNEGLLTGETPAEVAEYCIAVDAIDQKTRMPGPDAMKVLADFVKTIDATGGVFRDPRGYFCPRGDDEWVDLGEAYVAACAALGRRPKVVKARPP